MSRPHAARPSSRADHAPLARIRLGCRSACTSATWRARDWGHARDYVEAIGRILQQKQPDDFVIATAYSTACASSSKRRRGTEKKIAARKGADEKGYTPRPGHRRRGPALLPSAEWIRCSATRPRRAGG